ncbi:MAG: CRISPR-associated endonuclease Cas2 [Alphaproteobacteria bacterium]|nr:CRISPR-associated endonuclease Cas2 [Alphaproteobacteria bacterium]
MRNEDHLYIVTYDIRDPKRWRRLFKAMQGRGEWLQLSVFQCRLSRRGFAEMTAVVTDIIKHDEDHVVILDLGVADEVKPRVTSMGKGFKAVTRETIIV